MYLISTGPDPFSAAEIREAIGLRSSALDLVIAAGIGLITSLSRKPIRNEVWAIAEGDDAHRYGTPVSIGAPRRLPGPDTRTFRDCTYRPDPEAVALARRRVIAWCDNQDDITLLRGREHSAGHAASPIEVPAERAAA